MSIEPFICGIVHYYVSVYHRLEILTFLPVPSSQVWTPKKQYETFSFLPLMAGEALYKQVQYMINNGWHPCVEFDVGSGFVTERPEFGPCYYDNRYWAMYKLPMFGTRDANEVMEEVENCKREYPNAFVRICAFDNIKQVQSHSFIVAKPN